MSNNLITTQKLPAHLQALMGDTRLQTLNQDAAKGISAGSWPRISLKGGRFRLQDPQGQELVVPVNFLDVVIIATNPHGVSKIYYAGAYDPAGDGTAPTCYSDNGVAPSARAAKPQCGACGACPHNAWGSKVTPSGAQVKACADIKKLAVLLADNTAGPVFELRVPAASLTNLGAYVRGLEAAGVPAASVVTRLSFDTDADYPKLVFGTPTVVEGHQPWAHYPYITAGMMEDVREVISGDEVKLCTGENDKPITALPAVQDKPGTIGGLPPANLTYGPVRAPLAAPPGGGHVSGPALPVGHFGPPPPPNPAFPHTGQPVPAQEAQPKTRTRRTKAQLAGLAVGPQQLYTRRTKAQLAEAAAGQQQLYTPPTHEQVNQAADVPGVPGFLSSRRGQTSAQPQDGGQFDAPKSRGQFEAGRDTAAPVNPPVTDAAMDEMLNQAMST